MVHRVLLWTLHGDVPVWFSRPAADGERVQDDGGGVDVVEFSFWDLELDPVVVPGLDVHVPVQFSEMGPFYASPAEVGGEAGRVFVFEALLDAHSFEPDQFAEFEFDVYLV